MALIVAALLSAASAPAATTTYYWDSDGGSSSATGGNGSWNTSYQYWRAGSDTGTLTTWANETTSVSAAYFGGSAGTVAISSGSTIYTNGIIFGASGYTISGNNYSTSILYLDGAAPSIQLGANSATINNVVLRITDNATAAVVGTGTLTISGSSAFAVGGRATGANTTLDLSGLSSFVFNEGGTAFSVGGQANSTSAAVTSSGTLILAGSSSITSSVVNVGATSPSSGGSGLGHNTGVLLLGGTTAITTGTIVVGGPRNTGIMQFASGVSNGLTVIRGTNASQRADVLIAYNNVAGNGNVASGTVDLRGGTVDALVGSMVIGQNLTNSSANASGAFLMGSGTLDATSIVIAQRISSSANILVPTGLLQIDGGTVKVQTLTLTDIQNANSNGGKGTVNFNGGLIKAQTLQAGASNNTNGTNIRAFNWSSGTIANYDSNTDLTITGLTLSATGTGVHTFSADAGRSITIDSTSSVAGNGGITKSGAGRLVVAGTISATGITHLTEGTLDLANSEAFTLATGGVSLDAGGTGKLTSSVANANLGGDLTMASGAISPGDNGAVGTLTLAAGKNFTMSGGVLTVDLGSDYDQILGSSTGLFSITGGELVVDITGAGFSYGSSYSILSGFSAGSVADLTITGYDTAEYTATLSDSGILSFTAVPEPQTYGMLVGGIGALLFLRRATRRKAAI